MKKGRGRERRDSSGKTEKSRVSMEQVKGDSGCGSKMSILLLNMVVVVEGGRGGKVKFGIWFR